MGTLVKFAELVAYRPRIEAHLRREYDRERPNAPTNVRPYLRLNEGLTLRGGKRFRAILLLAGYHIASGRRPDVAIGPAAALEHFQSWMLIHDDIIDHSAERRGGPTVHRAAAALRGRGAPRPEAEEFGVGIGITLGDLEEPATVEGLLGAAAPGPARLAALAEYARMTRLTAYGQLLDIRNGTRPPAQVREADVYLVHELKSAVYTVVAPLRIGALLGGARPDRLEDLAAWGRDIGVAFQLRDDVLGAGFSAVDIGKSSNDIVEGKRTLLIVRAWATATAAERRELERALGRPTATAREIRRALEILRSTGSLAYSERAIARLGRRASRRLAESRTIRSAAKPLLAEIGQRLIERSV